jgi:hypothetical protein
MEHLDYYLVMEKRIKYLSLKYDPLNKFPLEWKIKAEQPKERLIETPLSKKRLSHQISAILNSVIAFLF